MKQSSKKLLSVLMALALVVGLMPWTALPVFADPVALEDPVEYPLWVGGEQVTSTNLSGTGWSYTPAVEDDPETDEDESAPATLTLNGYSYEGEGYEGAAIFTDEDLTIVLTGENTVTQTNAAQESYSYGIYGGVEKTLTITGTGTLVANSDAAEFESCGIRIYGDLIIAEGVTVQANGGETGSEEELANSSGVCLQGNLTVNGKLDATGNTGSTAPSYGIFGEAIVVGETGTVTATGGYGIHTYGDITINGGTVTATGESAGISSDGSVEIKEDVVSVVASSNDGDDNNAIAGTVKNAVAGTGWTNKAGTEGEAAIAVSTTGESFDYKKVQFPAAHTHSLTYAAGTGENANTVTATCTAGGCTDPAYSATLTIAATGGTYDGTTAFEATVTDADSIRGEAAVSYYNANDDGNRTGEALTGAPTDAGKYWAEITLGTGNNTATAHVVYEIGKADQTAPAAPTKAAATINSITLTAITNGEYRKGTDGTWQDSPTFTGLAMNTEYTFYQRTAEDDNHNASPASESASISTNDHVHEWSYTASGATVTATCANTDGGHGTPLTATLTIVAPEHTAYGDGKSAEANVTGSIDGVETPAIVYKKGTETLNAAPTDAGTYTADITLGEGDGAATASANYTIAPKTLTITADSASKTVDGTALTKDTYTATELAGGDVIESVTVTGTQTEVGSSANIPSAAVIKNGNTDVTGNYAITYVNGTLTVNAIPDGDYDDGGSAPADGTAPKTVYTVIWRGANGKELDRKTYEEGQPEPKTDIIPEKVEDKTSTYTFSRWVLLSKKNGTRIYKPEFKSVKKKSYIVSFDLNGHGVKAPKDQTVWEGQYATAPEAPANDGDFTFGGWMDAPENGKSFRFDETKITKDMTLYAYWIENLPEIKKELVMEPAPTVGGTLVLYALDFSFEMSDADLQTLLAAAESVKLPVPENEEEIHIQELAMQDAVNNIDKETKQQENQSALAALIGAGLVMQDDDGLLPEDIGIDIKREIYMDVAPKGLFEEEIGQKVRKVMSIEINPCYNVFANLTGDEENIVPVSGGNPTKIDEPINLSLDISMDFADPDQDCVFINHEHDDEEFTYLGMLAPEINGLRTLSFCSLGLSPFEITTDRMAAMISGEENGTGVDLYYATLAKAVAKVKDGGTITLIEPVKEDVVPADKTYTVVLAPEVDQSLTEIKVDGEPVAFVDGKATIDPEGSCPISKFTDASPTAWYHEGVHWALVKGIMSGTGDTTFEPDGSDTRATVVTMLWRLAGEPAASGVSGFADVSSGAEYEQAVNWAASIGVVEGTSETTFSPDAPVTREQLATILYRYAQTQGKGFTGAWAFPLDFTDAADVSGWADEAMHWMTMNGVINGMGDGTLAPKDNATRAQIATMFMRFWAVLTK